MKTISRKNYFTFFTRFALIIILFVPITLLAENKNLKAPLRFGLSFPKERSQTLLDGRMLLMLSADSAQEPRFQITDDSDTQLLFWRQCR